MLATVSSVFQREVVVRREREIPGSIRTLDSVTRGPNAVMNASRQIGAKIIRSTIIVASRTPPRVSPYPIPPPVEETARRCRGSAIDNCPPFTTSISNRVAASPNVPVRLHEVLELLSAYPLRKPARSIGRICTLMPASRRLFSTTASPIWRRTNRRVQTPIEPVGETPSPPITVPPGPIQDRFRRPPEYPHTSARWDCR